MTNLQKILIGTGIIGSALIATPMIYNSQINKFIQQEQVNLQQQQIEIKESKNSDSFFETNREYILTIKNSIPFIKKIYPQIDYLTLNSLKENLDNTKFLVKLNLTKLPIYHKDAVKIYLYSLNNKNDKQILDAIKNRVFEVILDINNLKISKARLKDIDLTLKDENSQINFKIKKAIANIEKNELLISQIALNLKENSNYNQETDNIVINNLTSKTKEKNLLNYSSELKINSIHYSQNSKYNNTKLNIKNIKNYSDAVTILNKTSIKNRLNIKTFNLKSDNNLLKVDNFNYNIIFSNLDTKPLKNIIEITQNSANLNPITLFQDIGNLVQKGLKIEVSPISFDKAEIVSNDGKKFNIKPLKIEVEAELSKNNYNVMTEPPEVLLDKIDGKLKITTEKENIDILNNNFPLFSLYFRNLFKEENNKVLINLEYQKGKITSNGKPIF